jgi:hypothetical protein
MRLYPLLFILLLNVLVVSCDSGLQGDLNENLPPKTSLTLNEINLPEGERLVSQVNISWWGDDPDGFITGYEFYIGDPTNAADQDWSFTQSTDSTFILPIPQGNIEADVQFTVRAVDNDGSKDPEPPSLTFPIKNTPPEVSFAVNETPPDTTYRVASFGFNPSDPDGNANLNRIEIALNDTSSDGWKEISLDVNFITLRIDDTQPNPVASVMLGRSAVESDIQFETVNMDAENELYVRTFDNAEAVSDLITYNWYVKRQTSRILFLNDYFGTNTDERGALHLSILDSIGIDQVDYIDISDGQVLGGTRVPLTSAFPNRSLAEPTINMMLAEWDYIYWISDDLDRNIGYALEITDQFFNEGGKMFINIPIEKLAERNSLFQFLPFRGVQEATFSEPARNPQYFIENCSDVTLTDQGAELAQNSQASNGQPFSPNIQFDGAEFPAYSIIPFNESISLFETDFSIFLRNPNEIVEFEGNEVISTMNPDQNILYFGVDLDEFTKNSGDCSDPETNQDLPASNLSDLIEFLTIETLGFEQ